MLAAIVAMARSMGLSTVAEGVETAQQREDAAAAGCDLLQGYLLGRPQSVADFERRHLQLPSALPEPALP